MASSLIIALDDIRSHHNVGSCFRSADAFGVDQILLGGITPRPPHRDIQKTALGATETVTWSYEEHLAQKVLEYQALGYLIIAVEQVPESIPLSEVALKGEEKLLLIFGNEVKGVSSELINLADQAWEIPQVGVKKSLNISVCAGICMYFSSVELRK